MDDLEIYCPRRIYPDEGGLYLCVGPDCALWDPDRDQCGDLTSAQSLARIAEVLGGRC